MKYHLELVTTILLLITGVNFGKSQTVNGYNLEECLSFMIKTPSHNNYP